MQNCLLIWVKKTSLYHNSLLAQLNFQKLAVAKSIFFVKSQQTVWVQRNHHFIIVFLLLWILNQAWNFLGKNKIDIFIVFIVNRLKLKLLRFYKKKGWSLTFPLFLSLWSLTARGAKWRVQIISKKDPWQFWIFSRLINTKKKKWITISEFKKCSNLEVEGKLIFVGPLKRVSFLLDFHNVVMLRSSRACLIKCVTHHSG